MVLVLIERDLIVLMVCVFLCVRPVKSKKRGGGFTKVCQLSPQLEKVVGTSQLARTEVICFVIFFKKLFWSNIYLLYCLCCVYDQVVKKMWAYIRENDLQDPKDRRKIVCDELLHSLFRVKTINMFQMNKALTKHIWPLRDGDGNFLSHIYCIHNFHWTA